MCAGEPHQDEVERLKSVYSQYARISRGSGKWARKNLGNQVMVAERHLALLRVLEDSGFSDLSSRTVLDVGCGSGGLILEFLRLGVSPQNCFGIDLMPDYVQRARMVLPSVDLRVGNAERLPYPDDSFDLVVVFTVFSSILDRTMATNVSGQIRRVLKPAGAVVYYDFRFSNPSNRNVRGLGKSTIETLFPGYSQKLRSITLCPPLARRLGRATTWMYPLLSRLPFMRSHYLGLLVKPPGSAFSGGPADGNS